MDMIKDKEKDKMDIKTPVNSDKDTSETDEYYDSDVNTKPVSDCFTHFFPPENSPDTWEFRIRVFRCRVFFFDKKKKD